MNSFQNNPVPTYIFDENTLEFVEAASMLQFKTMDIHVKSLLP